MANIMAATFRLMESKGPQEITLRDVAAESGHGPRLIVRWFGGKGGLFEAIFMHVFADLNQAGEMFYADLPTRPEVRKVFRLLSYMQMHHPEYVEAARQGEILRTYTSRLETVLNLPREQADRVARRIITLVTGLALYSEMFGLTDDEVIEMVQNETKSLIGITPPARPPSYLSEK